MNNENASIEGESPPQAKWQPLSAIQRRVVGVLVEKAKTTPDAYPLSLNALTNGCNQKSNRAPKMNLDTDDIEQALDQLRLMGAVGEVQGGGRVVRYRHYMKEWLGVDGTELAVMAELLLRGPQTVGELRGRAARMAHDQLPDLSSLRPVLSRLTDLGLVVALTPGGRGQIITHALYLPDELEKLRRQAASSPGPASEPPARATASPAARATTASPPELDQLRSEVSQLKAELKRLRKEIEDIWSSLR